MSKLTFGWGIVSLDMPGTLSSKQRSVGFEIAWDDTSKWPIITIFAYNKMVHIGWSHW